MHNKKDLSAPKVSVCMITYAHEKYIREAIEGVLMQECDFEVELIIANDCSPDGTDQIVKEIIKNHPRGSWIKYFNHKENLGMMPNFIFALQECKGEYIALCDGDDYWIDPLKLKKQVEFLDANEDYIIHSGNAVFKSDNPRTNQKPVFIATDVKVLELKDFLVNNNLCTCTVIFRSIQIKLPENFIKITFGDWYYYVLLLQATNKKVLRTDEVYSTYRIHEGGVMKSLSTISFYQQHIFQIQTIKHQVNYKKLKYSSREIADSYFLELYKSQLKEKVYSAALKTTLANLKFSQRSFSFLKHIKITAKYLILK